MTDTPPTTDEGCVKWTLSAGDVSVQVTASLNADGDVVFSYDLLSGVADLNGLYVDLNNDGGTIRKLEGGNNMNGSDSDGDKLDGFDWAAIIGTVGGNDADTTSGTVTVSMADLGITSLADLDGAEIGIRATSVGDDREGSLKLADTGTYCEPEEPPQDLCDRPVDGTSVEGYVPMQDKQLVSLTLVFFDSETTPTPGDVSGDGYYTVTINVPAEMGEDPDAYLDQIVALLVAEDPYIAAGYADLNPSDPYFLKSVIVTDCDGHSENYAVELDEFGDNPGEAPDLLAWGLFGTGSGEALTDAVDMASHIDATYDLAITGDEFIFA